MGTRDPRIDAYITKAPEFARPILSHVRQLVHSACPDVEETIKWGHPAFEYHGMLGGMAAFKQHCTFGFWKHDLIVGKNGAAATAMGSFGRLTKLSDLPGNPVLKKYIKEGARLNKEGVSKPKPKAKPKAGLAVPADLAAALKKSKKALATFDAMPPSHRREYIEWITEAKREETRTKRLATTIEWLAEGKSRNWKYENC
jgi:uncharacterized protein YdeI (YjbR/CyaY-like superfamily)